jgi:hypothetical protein
MIIGINTIKVKVALLGIISYSRHHMTVYADKTTSYRHGLWICGVAEPVYVIIPSSSSVLAFLCQREAITVTAFLEQL